MIRDCVWERFDLRWVLHTRVPNTHVFTKHTPTLTHTHSLTQTRTHTYTQIHKNTAYAHTRAHTHACTSARTHVCAHTDIHTHTHSRTHIHTHTYTHTHTHTHAHTHIHIHAHTNTHKQTHAHSCWRNRLHPACCPNHHVHITRTRHQMESDWTLDWWNFSRQSDQIFVSFNALGQNKPNDTTILHVGDSMYSLLHLEWYLISISDLNLLGLFSTERGKRDLKN